MAVSVIVLACSMLFKIRDFSFRVFHAPIEMGFHAGSFVRHCGCQVLSWK